jgi:hypothetical protein
MTEALLPLPNLKDHDKLFWRRLSEFAHEQFITAASKLKTDIDPRYVLVSLEREHNYTLRKIFMSAAMMYAYNDQELSFSMGPKPEEDIIASIGMMTGTAGISVEEGTRPIRSGVYIFYRDLRGEEDQLDEELGIWMRRTNDVIDESKTGIERVPTLVDPQGLPLI